VACVAALSMVHGQEGFQWAKELIFKLEKCGIFVLKKFYIIELK
jgi:hypothetical protein